MNDQALLLKNALLLEEGHPRRTRHILAVLALAELLGDQAGLTPEAQRRLSAAAILHDIAIKPCKERFGQATQAQQQALAPELVRALLRQAGYAPSWEGRILDLVLAHHCYGPTGDLELRLLIEADLLVNFLEGGALPPGAEGFVQTPAALALLHAMEGRK